ncbi:MAG TPA: ATP-binding protein [Pseudolabrys sp.]|nr:ATP-binding protein [Pseudolabrys sp.]
MVDETRSSYATLAIAALLPIVLFASVIAVLVGFREQDALRDRALSNVREIANGIDRFIASQLKAGEVMAHANALTRGDLPAFYAYLERLKEREPDWVSATLVDTAGNQLMNLARPYGTPLPKASDMATVAKALRSDKPVVGDFVVRSLVTGRPFVPIRVPVDVDGHVKYLLSIGLDPTGLSRLFALSGAPGNWIGAVVDRNGTLIARSVRGKEYIGHSANPNALEAIKTGGQGVYGGNTLEGLSTVFAFYTSPLTGWSVHYAVPRNEYQAPLYRVLWMVVLSGLVAVVLAIVLFVLVARQNARQRKAQLAAFQSQKLEALGQFTSGIAHDFNNLLMAVMGNLELAAAKLDGDPAARNVERAYAAAKRGADLNAQLLAFARKRPPETTVASLNAAIEGAAELLRATLGQTIELRCDLKRDLWLAAIDPAQIEVALLNLVSNARDAMPRGGLLHIATRNVPAGSERVPAQLNAADLVEVEVKDNGRGMTPDVLARALEPFFTTKPAGKGTGLGLSQIHGMIAQMKGAVTIHSAPDRGTSVRLFLPRALPGAVVAPAPEVAAAVRPAASGLRVLVVDDDAQVLAPVAEMLRSLGHEPLEAAGGAEALRLVETDRSIDLVLSDHAMPEMTGSQFAEIMRTRRPDLRIVLMTGYAEDIPQNGAIRAVIRKPFTAETLAQYL